MIKVSVIIPVYNTPYKYLKKCIDSVLSQTYFNIEVIIVDDGSTHFETLHILSKLSNKILVIHKLNGGQATARNLGIAYATGDYLIFIDSDDYWLSETLISDIVELLDSSCADLLSFSYAKFFDESQRLSYCKGSLPRSKIYGKPKEKAVKELLKSSRKTFSSVMHTKVIKAELLRRHNICFEEKINNEDTLFTIQLIQFAKTYDRLNKVGYAFRRNNLDSDTQSSIKQLKIERDMIKVFDYLFVDGSATEIILDFLGSSFVYWMGKVVRLQAMECPDLNNDIQAMEKYRYVMFHSSRWYIRMMGYITIIGLPASLWILGIYLRVNRHHVLSISRKIKE